MMGIGADKNLSTQLMKLPQKRRRRIGVLLSSPVQRSEVYLKGNAFPHQIFHGFHGRAKISRIFLIHKVHGIIEPGHQVEVTDEHERSRSLFRRAGAWFFRSSALSILWRCHILRKCKRAFLLSFQILPYTVDGFRRRLKVSPAEPVIISAEILPAHSGELFFRIIKGEKLLPRLQIVGGTDDVFCFLIAFPVSQGLALQPAEDFQPAPVCLLQPVKLGKIGLGIHMEFRIKPGVTVAGESQPVKSQLQRSLNHLLRCAFSVAEGCMGVKIAFYGHDVLPVIPVSEKGRPFSRQPLIFHESFGLISFLRFHFSDFISQISNALFILS